MCEVTLTLTASAINVIAIVFTLFQFLLRVKVIYCEGNRLKTGFFVVLWMVASGGTSMTLAFGIPGCTIPSVDFSFWVPVLAVLVFDSCVFLAISYQIFKLSLMLVSTDPQFSPLGDEFGTGSRTRLSFTQSLKTRLLALAGKGLPSLFQAILHDGQFYYLISSATGVTTLSLLLNTSLLPAYRPLLVPIHSVLVNITAGYVFREVRLGRMREHELTLAFQQSTVEEILSLHSIHHDEEPEEAPS
ncbi:hypothetical protein BDP27DRAFT_1323276 [Rhodocollybia butyracea]|uniref:Uncharacterized protein n=1 Tax=Rhodocollybia butyracea TaxID=206335 RepID=A0A9P5PZ67_9AGAR|nr:hypothetical protein BDP27DRAFT_1323276 [Rhodocollybia butyracea]